VPPSGFVTDEIISSKSIGLGDGVFMIGRFIDHAGEGTNYPAARFGNISIMPTMIDLGDGYGGECYCLDMHSRTGYSGSPVFVYRTSNTNLDAIFKDRVEAGSPGIYLYIYLGYTAVNFQKTTAIDQRQL